MRQSGAFGICADAGGSEAARRIDIPMIREMMAAELRMAEPAATDVPSQPQLMNSRKMLSLKNLRLPRA